MWDNVRLQEKVSAHETPLYLSWLSTNHSLVLEQMSAREAATALARHELKQVRKSSINKRSLASLCEQITRNIKQSDILVPIRCLLRERARDKCDFSSIYREVLFLVLVALERELIDTDAFDTEYRVAYKMLLGGKGESSQEQAMRPADKPPNNVAVWCRRLFSPLMLWSMN